MTPSSLREAADLLPERAAALNVEPGRRLVEEEDARRVDQGEREVEPALHPAGVAAHLAVGRLREPDALEQDLASPRALRARDSLQRRLQAQVLAAREQGIERRLLERCADRRPDLRALADDVVAGHRAPSRRSAAAGS